MSFKNKLDLNKIPRHVAIIMDGNGRWAKKRNKQRIFGHREGANSIKAVVEAAIEINIKYVTLYAFSTENWNRPKLEVESLMKLLVKGVDEQLSELHKRNIKINTIGDENQLPNKVKNSIEKAKNKTGQNTGLNLIIALSYSSRWEILDAVKKICKDFKKNTISEMDITEDLFSNYLTTKDFPDPELLIRTSGEQRISNFLLWQISYSELIFTKILWPDYRKEEFFESIYEYQQRERRYGKTSEQLIITN